MKQSSAVLEEVILQPSAVHAAEYSEPSIDELPVSAYARVKFVVEWLLALMLFILTGPLVLILAALVGLTSRGPSFYSQRRLGYRGRTYQMHKLRTMVQDAEAGTGAVWARQRDTRVTRIGRILRATHLDELPQLWNVLKGEMSLIGPRPERPEIATRIERTLPHFGSRLQVRPGITGLAQMLLPADDPGDLELHGVRKKLACDLYYIRKLSLLLDLRIALCTPCHFIGSAITGIGRGLLQSHGTAVAESSDEKQGDYKFEMKLSRS